MLVELPQLWSFRPKLIQREHCVIYCQNRFYRNLCILHRSHLTQIPDIAQWRVTEQAAVLSAELGGALITDLKRRSCSILIFGEHQSPRFIQTQPFLVLQRTHGCHCPKMMVEGRCTHIDLSREVIDTQRLCEVSLHPIDCLSYLITLTSSRCHLSQANTLISYK